MPVKAKQGKVIRELYECDHAFISKEGVAHFTEPFGFMGSTYLAKSDPPGTFKGLTLHDKDGNALSEMEGQAAHKIALEIASHLGVDVPDMHGIGSQLRIACSKILESLNNEKVAA